MQIYFFGLHLPKLRFYLFIHSFSMMFWVKNWGIEKLPVPSFVTPIFHIVFLLFSFTEKEKKRTYMSVCSGTSSVSGCVGTVLPVCGSNNMEVRWGVAGWWHCLVCQKSRWQVFKAPQSWGLWLLLLSEAILHLIVLSFPFIFLLSAQEKPSKRKCPTQPWVLIWIQMRLKLLLCQHELRINRKKQSFTP